MGFAAEPGIKAWWDEIIEAPILKGFEFPRLKMRGKVSSDVPSDRC